MEVKEILGTTSQGAGHIIAGEARERLAPIKKHLLESTENVQSQAGRQILSLAEKIRQLGAQLDRGAEVQTIARKLEETADYVRFRSPDGIARDAARALKRHHVIPIAAGLVGAALAYKLISKR